MTPLKPPWNGKKKADNNQQNLAIKIIPHEQKRKRAIKEQLIKPRFVKLNLDLLDSDKKKHQGHLDKWANKIAVHAGKSVKTRKEVRIRTKNKVINMERLTAKLRDLHQTDHVAMLLFVNGYYEHYPSFTMHSSSNGPKTEYAVITNKNPAIIAHEFLHLSGAVDLYPNPTYPSFNFKALAKAYPNEIMRIQHQSIQSLMMSPITMYYIGWQKNLVESDTRMLYHQYEVLPY